MEHTKSRSQKQAHRSAQSVGSAPCDVVAKAHTTAFFGIYVLCTGERQPSLFTSAESAKESTSDFEALNASAGKAATRGSSVTKISFLAPNTLDDRASFQEQSQFDSSMQGSANEQ